MLVVHGARAYKLILYFKKYCILNSYLGCVKNIFLSITGPYCGDRGVFPSYPGSVWSQMGGHPHSIHSTCTVNLSSVTYRLQVRMRPHCVFARHWGFRTSQNRLHFFSDYSLLDLGWQRPGDDRWEETGRLLNHQFLTSEKKDSNKFVSKGFEFCCHVQTTVNGLKTKSKYSTKKKIM